MKHAANCNHCASICGANNPAKRPEVRVAISDAARRPEEHARRSAAVTGDANPRYSVGGSYNAAHLRVVAERGRAAEHTCSCAAPAEEWALIKARAVDVQVGPGPRGALLPYSLDITDYDPLCRSCHRKLDAVKRADYERHT